MYFTLSFTLLIKRAKIAKSWQKPCLKERANRFICVDIFTGAEANRKFVAEMAVCSEVRRDVIDRISNGKFLVEFILEQGIYGIRVTETETEIKFVHERKQHIQIGRNRSFRWKTQQGVRQKGKLVVQDKTGTGAEIGMNPKTRIRRNIRPFVLDQFGKGKA